MLQERTGNKKDSTVMDFILIAVIILVIVYIKKIFALCMTFPSPWNAIAQAAVFIAFVAGCYLFYTKRITDLRYSVVYHQPEEGEKNIFGDEKEYPWPVGTVLFERMIANKGKLIFTIEPAELVALLEPGETYGEKISAFRTERLSGAGKRKSHTLIYKKKNKLYAAFFSPTDEFAGHVRDAVAANAAR